MTQAQPVFPGFAHHMSRRTTGQAFFLRPDPETANAYRYTLGLTLAHFRGRFRLHAASQMSSHDHLVGSDQDAERTDFLSRRNGLLARCLNTLRRRKGRFFDAPTRKNNEHLLTPDQTLRTIVYALCNPVAANLCDWPHEWPGSLGDWRQILTVPITATKPLSFYDQASPEHGGQVPGVVYYLTKPACFEDLEDPDYEALIRDEVQAECERLHAERTSPPLGVEAALALPFTSTTLEPDTEVERDARRFRGDPEQVARFFEAWIAWTAAYLEARARWIRGEREGVEFPPGTDAYRRQEEAPTQELGPDSPFAALAYSEP